MPREIRCDSCVYIETAWREADLPGIAEFERDAGARDCFRVNVIEYDNWRVPPKLHRRWLQMLRRLCCEEATNRHRSSKRNLPDNRRSDETSGNLRRYAKQNVQRACRYSSINESANEFNADSGRFLRRLEYDRASSRSRRGR